MAILNEIRFVERKRKQVIAFSLFFMVKLILCIGKVNV
jgi:hypothetical protein